MRLIALLLAMLFATSAAAQDFSKYSEDALRAWLAENASVEAKLLMPMRDGVGLSTDIYRPKDAKGRLPAIFNRTPYNINTLSGFNLRFAAEAVSRGYAYVLQNERGRYFSEGKFEILGYPRTDGYDALSWLAARGWSNGKVGTLGCSSSAEWQLALAAMNHPAHAAMVPMAAGAGIGRVGEFHEQGNWYMGGVPRSLFWIWLYGVDNPLRAQLPAGLDPATRARIAQYNDLHAKKPEVNWAKQVRHLPVADLLKDLGEPPATFEQFITRTPGDPAWLKGGLYHDNEGWGVPALWFNSWYDVSVGPNMALFNHARKAGSDKEASANQHAVIAPVAHCHFLKVGPNTVVGERSMGDTSFEVVGEIFGWFDRWLKGRRSAFPAGKPAVRYFAMGENKWKSAAQWPPENARAVRMYLRSGGAANSLYGNGRLDRSAPAGEEQPDRFTYDPMNPVQTIGGGDCCNGGLVTAGAFDQRVIEARQDVLVYTSDPLTESMEVTGFIDTILHVSSDAKDTDFAVKLVDVAPDGTAYILADTILRARYREGYDRQVMMAPGGVYKLDFTPMTISNTFLPGHRIRVEITSSNFPKFARNLNTGGDNVTERTWRVARNAVHHSASHASYIELPVVR
jgi:hypothetical protein